MTRSAESQARVKVRRGSHDDFVNDMQRYEARSFRFIELRSIGDWRMKVYGIAWCREWLRRELLESAKRIASAELAKTEADNYQVDPRALTPAQDSDSSICVWDLRLQSFEREAWIKHVLCNPEAPDLESYLGARLNGYV